MEINGVDLSFPVSQRDGTFQVRVYLSPADTKQQELHLEPPAEVVKKGGGKK